MSEEPEKSRLSKSIARALLAFDSMVDSAMYEAQRRSVRAYQAISAFSDRFRLTGFSKLAVDLACEALDIGLVVLIIALALALPALQAKLDAEAAAQHAAHADHAFVPGAGFLPERNAADIAWSEFNHHWAGVFVTLIGLLALLNQAGVRWARHWPLVFMGLAVFLFLRSDPEVWPMGDEGFFESLRDIEVLQHRFFVFLTVAFSLFEWRVRLGGWKSTWAPKVFPLLTAVGGAALLTHSHQIANVKDALLIELTHTPLALCAIAAGWARWLEIRSDGKLSRVAGWLWPVLFVVIGLILLDYREA